MPVIKQKVIYREELQANRRAFYLFGDNMDRRGWAGQAKEMRGEPNAVGIPTKWYPGAKSNAYFRDNDDLSEVFKVYDETFALLNVSSLSGLIIVIPLDGIGTGYAKLPETAPKLYADLLRRLNNIPNQ